MKGLEKILEYIIRVSKKSRTWRTSVFCLAAIVVFTTTYSLILPAITVEKSATENVGGLVMEEADPGSTGAEAEAPGEVMTADAENETPDETLQEEVPDASSQTPSSENDSSENGTAQPASSQTETAQAAESTAVVDEEVKEPVNGEVRTIGDRRIMTLRGEDFDVVVSGDLSVGVSDGTVLSVRGISDADVVRSFSDRITDELFKIFVDTKTTEVLYQLVFTDKDLVEYSPAGNFDVQFIFHNNTVSHTGEMVYAAVYDYLTDEMILAEKNSDVYKTPVISLNEYGIITGITLKGLNFGEYSDIITLVAGPVNEERKLTAEQAADSAATDSRNESSAESVESGSKNENGTESAESDSRTESGTESADSDGKTESSSESTKSETEKTESTGTKADSADSRSEGPSAKAKTSKESKKAENGTLTARGSDYTVTLTYSAEAEIPANAVLEVTEIENGTSAYRKYLEQAKAAMGLDKDQVLPKELARFFDIRIMADGKEVQPAANVSVNITYDQPVAEADPGAEAQIDANAVHFGKEGAEVVEVSDSDASRVEFEAESFSVYGIIYTVDFTYDGFTFNLGGRHEIALSELLQILSINELIENVEDISIELIQQNDEIVDADEFYAEQISGDWLLKSNHAFGNIYELKLNMKDGACYTIIVSDAGSDLTPMLGAVNITIDGQVVTGDDWTVKKDQIYDLHLVFAETPDTDNQFGAQTMTYKLPDSFNVSGTSGTFFITYNDQQYGGSTYTIDPATHMVTVSFSDSVWPLVQDSGNARITIDVSGSFSSDQRRVEFGNGITKDVDVDETHDINISKTGTYNSATNKIDYTLTVRSEGVNEKIEVTDTITGSALTFDGVGGVIVNGAGSCNTVPNGSNGFKTVIERMGDGDVVTINYSASVDFNNITGTGTAGETGNTAKITTQDIPDKPPVNHNMENEIDYNPLSKSAGTATGDGNIKTLPWTITVNQQQLKDVTGMSITDRISARSQDIMSYSGSGITVTVMDGNNQIDSYTVPWSNLGVTDPSSNKTWSYTIPETYKDHSYKYVITYNTTVDVTGKISDTNVDNTISDGDGHTGSGSGIVGPGEDAVDIHKTHKNEDVTSESIKWTVDFKVPKNGLSSAVVTDIFPSKRHDQHYQDTLDKNFDIQVSGLIPGEKYDVDTSSTDRVIFTFYYLDENDQRVEGLKGYESERRVYVTLQTLNDQDWVQNHPGGTDHGTHTNTAQLTVDGQSLTTTDSASPSNHGISKSAEEAGTVTIDGIEYPIYKYTLGLFGLTSGDFINGKLSIVDDYDENNLKFYDRHDDWWTQVFYAGNTSYQVSPRRPLTVGNEITDQDGKLTFTITPEYLPTISGISGAYYNTYHFVYYLIVKDKDALDRLNNASIAASSDGFSVTMGNSVRWGDFSSDADVTYKYPGVDKELLSTDPSKRLANYKIVLNPAQIRLNDGIPMTLTDHAENIAIDYQTIQITVEPAEGVEASVNDVTYYYSGYDGYFTIPDQCRVMITYSARIIGDGIVTIKNDAIMKGFSDETKKTENISSSSEGQLEINWIRIFKHQRYAMDKPLNGAEYTLCDENGNILLYPSIATNGKAGQPITFVTGTAFTAPETSGVHPGYVQIYLNQAVDGMSLQKGRTYYLKETKAPDGYQISTRIYNFTIADHPDYDDYEYYNDDVMRLADTPNKGVLEVFKSFEGAENLTETQKQQITFSISGTDNEENQIFSQNISYADFSNGKYRLTNLDPGTYTVKETGWTISGYQYVSTTYTVDGEEGTSDKTGVVVISQEDISNKTEHSVAYINKYNSTGISVNVKKTNEAGDIYLYGAEFQLFVKNQETGEYVLYQNDALDADSKFAINYENRLTGVTVTGLTDGEYKLVETAAPDGYYADPDYLEFTISDGTVSYSGEQKPANLISVENNSLTISNKQAHTYTLTKQDELHISKKLAGAEFAIYTYKGNQKVGETLITDSDGKVIIDAINYDFVEGTIYYIVETKAPMGYKLPDNPKKYYFYNGGTPSELAALSAAGESVVNLGSGPKYAAVPNMPEATDINVEKKWKDGSNQDTSAPEDITSIQFKLYQIAMDSDGNSTRVQYPDADTIYTIEKDSNNNWSYKITDLPTGKSSGGEVLTYTYEVEEVPVDGFITGYLNNGVNTGNITITNKPKYDSTNVEVQKVWLDENGNKLNNPPEEITVKLQRATASVEGWRVTVRVKGLYDQYAAGTVIVKEGTDVKATIGCGGDQFEIDGPGTWERPNTYQGILTIPNITSDTNVTITGNGYVNNDISWDYTEGDLSSTGEKVVYEEVTLRSSSTESENWHKIWQGLPKNDSDGNHYVYFVEEVSIDGKTPAEAGCTVEYENNNGIQNGIIYINNTVEEQKGALKLKKEVTVNGQPTTETKADGEYTFTVSGPGTEGSFNKTVTIKVVNGVASQYKFDSGSYLDIASDKYVVIPNLEVGEYTITETRPENGCSISKINGIETTSYSTTVNVVARDTTAMTENAAAVFTNNSELNKFEVIKIWKDASDNNTGWIKNIIVFLHSKPQSGDKTTYKYEVSQAADGTFNAVSITDGAPAASVSGNETAGYTIKWSDLPAGNTYSATEEKVSGYKDPEYAKKVADGENGIQLSTKDESGKDYAEAEDGMYIINRPEDAVTLPSTGGPGTRAFTILGIILILGAGVLLWRRRRLI